MTKLEWFAFVINPLLWVIAAAIGTWIIRRITR
jgi:hypothetical protein